MKLELKSEAKGRIKDLRSIKTEIRKVASSLESVINYNALETNSYNQVKKSLKRNQTAITRHSTSAGSMATVLQQIITLYENCEKEITLSGNIKSISPSFKKLNEGAIGISVLTYLLGDSRKMAGYEDNKNEWSMNKGDYSFDANFLGKEYSLSGQYYDGHAKDSTKAHAIYDPKHGEINAGFNKNYSYSALDGKSNFKSGVNGNNNNKSGVNKNNNNKSGVNQNNNFKSGVNQNNNNKSGVNNYVFSGSLLNITGGSAAGISLYTKDKFAPSAHAGVQGEATGAKIKRTKKAGSDSFNIFEEEETTVLNANAKAKFEAGTFVNDKGEKENRATLKAGAEAYALSGSIKGGITIAGVKVYFKLTGNLGGAGVTAGGEYTSNKAEGEIGAGLGVGGKLKAGVDWSDFELP